MNWINVIDELPKVDGMYLVFDMYNGIVVRPFNQYHNCWDYEDGDDYYCDAIGGKITHWMPLPDKPKSE